MKTLVLYASKTGVTEDCAKYISKHLENTVIQNVKKDKKNDLRFYERVIIGTPVYIGNPMKAISSYVVAHKDELMKKELYLFTCGAEGSKDPRLFLENSFSTDICDVAKEIHYFGTELRYDKMGFFGKLIMKKIATENNLDPKIKYDAIDQMIEKLS